MFVVNDIKLDSFTYHYAICALWSSNDESDPETGGDPLDDNYDLHDISKECLKEMKADCEDFQVNNKELLEQYYMEFSSEYAGHDFWLTRNGHGAGFWDRDIDVGDKLSDACKPYGTVDLYVHDGEIHC